MAQSDVLIVGGGLAGLCCARRLHQCGRSFTLVEASDALGGRVRTDLVDGYRLDRGFQIYLTAYPEGRRVLDLEELAPRKFSRGALIWYGGKLRRLTDPRTDPLSAPGSLFNPIGTFRDKLRLLSLQWKVEKGHAEQTFEPGERMTLDFLRRNGGFSDAMIDRFFKPFFGGVFLERELTTSSRFFRFVFRMFTSGDAVVPRDGMQEIPRQIARQLPESSILLNARVDSIGPGRATLGNGTILTAKTVVVAVEGPEVARLLGEAVPTPKFNGCTTLYYTTDRPPLDEPLLVLDGEGTGPVNNLVVMSAASKAYAPPGVSLISATVIGISSDDDAGLDRKCRTQLTKWFGESVGGWQLLRVYRIPNALPNMSGLALEPPQRAVRLGDGLYICGDHRDNGSIDGSMVSGFRTAQTIVNEMPTVGAGG